jgi:hypothetical protein
MKSYADYKKITDARDGVSYFDALAKERNSDPKTFDARCDEAEAQGKRDAAGYMNKVRDFMHPDHEKCLKTFQDKYGSSSAAVEKDCVAMAMKAAGAKRVEYRNTAYEDSALNKFKRTNENGGVQTVNYKVANQDDEATMAKFKATLRAKWNAEGYKNDADDIEDFWSKHTPLSTM